MHTNMCSLCVFLEEQRRKLFCTVPHPTSEYVPIWTEYIENFCRKFMQKTLNKHNQSLSIFDSTGYCIV